VKVAYVLYPDFTALGDRPVQMARRVNDHAAAARLRRARRTLSTRRRMKRPPAVEPTHPR
jgi:hypothetical protein